MSCRGAHWFVVLAALASSCVESALNPTDPVALHGQALFEDKRPMSGAKLELFRSANSACVGVGDFASLTADAQGMFHFDMTGADTQSGEYARCFRLKTPKGSKGATVEADFLVQLREVQVPTLQEWNGAVAVSATANGASISFAPLGSTHGVDGQSYILEARSGGGQVWSAANAASPAELSPWVLEDFSAVTATLSTRHEVKGSGTTFTLRYRSDELAIPVTPKIPVSRGASCAYNLAPSTCPLTDGQLTSVHFEQVPELTLELAQAKDVKKAVFRGLAFSGPASVVLEGSADNSVWTKLADVPNDAFCQLDLANGSNTRYLRVRGTRSDAGTFTLQSLSELSIFE